MSFYNFSEFSFLIYKIEIINTPQWGTVRTEVGLGLKMLINWKALFTQKRYFFSINSYTINIEQQWTASLSLTFSMKKNVVAHKLSSCFNTSEFLLLGGWGCVGWARGGCVGQTFQSENWQLLHSKGLSLTSHLPATGSYLTWGCLSSRKRWCGYMNRVVASTDGEMPLSLSLWP